MVETKVNLKTYILRYRKTSSDLTSWIGSGSTIICGNETTIRRICTKYGPSVGLRPPYPDTSMNVVMPFPFRTTTSDGICVAVGSYGEEGGMSIIRYMDESGGFYPIYRDRPGIWKYLVYEFTDAGVKNVTNTILDDETLRDTDTWNS